MSLLRLTPFGLILVGALAGCATPGPLVTLAPRSSVGVVWVSGRAVVANEKEGVRVAAAFEQQEGDALGVRLEIENDTARPFEVGPEGVTFMSCPAIDNATCQGSLGVVDPEGVLTGLDEQRAQTSADAANSQALYGTMVFLSAVGDVASIANGHAHATTGLQTAAVAENGQAAAAQSSDALSSFASQRQLWSDVALRKNTLVPGHGTAGLVFIPIDLKAHYLWIHVRAGGQIFPFGFQQLVRQVVPARVSPNPNPHSP
jgi:hypothetical protein